MVSAPATFLLQMVEYLVGDGPNNRYALICSNCHSHNGMALRDEFEYMSFRCAYCYHLNTARKNKPTLKAMGGANSTHTASGREGKDVTAPRESSTNNHQQVCRPKHCAFTQ